jgi:Ca2+-binding RTX toxin-like protein
MDGGPGRDGASFSTGDPLTLSLDAVANDGTEGQGANLLNIEFLGGGGANDTITGGAGPESLSGGAGADTINGGGGGDTLTGGSQNDSLSGGDGNDSLEGQSGDDALNGGAGTDLLYGHEGADDLLGGDGRDTVDFGGGSAYYGATVTLDDVANDGAEGEGDNAHADNENIIGTAGPDVLVGGPGSNTISGGDGYDTIVTREGGPAVASRDNVLCGADEDTVLADPTDQIGSGAEHCENVSYGDVSGYGPLMRVSAQGKDAGGRGTVPLLLRCPLTARGGCEGVATLVVKGRRAGRVRFSMRPGQEIERDLKLSRRARRAINRAKKSVRGVLTVAVADEIGATRTVTKNVKLTK